MSILPGEEQEPVCHYLDWSHDPCFPRLTEEEVDYGADLQASGEPDRLT
jgi:hypothetical protein